MVLTAESLSMTQNRHPRGIPTGGEFAANEHDEAAPIADDGFKEHGEMYKRPSDVKVGDIVWDGSSGFTVSAVRTDYLPRFAHPGTKRGISLHSVQGDFWAFSAGKTSVTVLRDLDVMRQKLDEIEEEYEDEEGW